MAPSKSIGLSETLSVVGQISLADVKEIARAARKAA
jgi:protein tyrosine phosphatase (PTP) superfamily phosphohydrolase (DUF442 family)